MTRIGRTLIAIAILGVVSWLAWSALSQRYLKPRAALIQQISSHRSAIEQQIAGREKSPKTRADIKAVVDRTLGPDRETVDHRMRSRLGRIAEQVGLPMETTLVNTVAATSRQSPARNEFSRSAAHRALREEVDFVELEGFIASEGTFEQALQLIAAIEAEPWIKRIDQLNLDPNENGERLDINVRLTTFFVPGRAPNPDAALTPRTATLQRWAAFAGTNPFRVPVAPPTPAAAAEAGQSEERGFPYEQWILTGVASSTQGPEIWLLNSRTRESLALAPGETIHDMRLESVLVESAEFTADSQRFLVNVGENLRDRHLIDQ